MSVTINHVIGNPTNEKNKDVSPFFWWFCGPIQKNFFESINVFFVYVNSCVRLCVTVCECMGRVRLYVFVCVMILRECVYVCVRVHV